MTLSPSASYRLAPFGVALIIFVLDRFTKWLIETYVSVWDNYVVIPGFFQIVHTRNRGAAFGILSDAQGEWRDLFLIGLSLVVMAFIAVLLWQTGRDAHQGPGTRFGLALVLGGALGNVYDRVVAGSVTDFLEFFIGDSRFPAFNVADSAITIGAGLLILDMWRTRHHAQTEKKVANERD